MTKCAHYCEGRGPLAGPVVTAACYITNGVFIEGIKDSKQTKEEEREEMYEILIKHPDVHWAATVVSHTEIDQVNILQATMNGMRRSTEDLLKKLEKQKFKGSYIALVDGNRVPTEMPIDAQYVIKGDGSIFSIAAASIIAKVTRDRIMVELDKEFPQYNLAQHKGYPTFEHRSLLMKHGPCRIHRTSYGPVKLAMQAQENRLARASVTASEESAEEVGPETGKRKRTTKDAVVEVVAAPAKAKKARVSKKAVVDEPVIAAAQTKKATPKRVTTKQTTAKKAAPKKANATKTVKEAAAKKVAANKSHKEATEAAVEDSVAAKVTKKRTKVVAAVLQSASASDLPLKGRKTAAKTVAKALKIVAETAAGEPTVVVAKRGKAAVKTEDGVPKRPTRASSR